MSKHTPGPWVIDYTTRPEEICTVYNVPPEGEDDQMFVYIRGKLGYWDTTPEEKLANARLIAAAPELLDALQKMDRILCEANPNCSQQYLFEQITKAFSLGREAIAKATVE